MNEVKKEIINKNNTIYEPKKKNENFFKNDRTTIN